jgi:hypothetical protein
MNRSEAIETSPIRAAKWFRIPIGVCLLVIMTILASTPNDFAEIASPGHTQISTNASLQPSWTNAPPPTLADVSYGPETRQRLDFWKAAGDRPTPVLIYFHGGAWKRGGRKNVIRDGLTRYLQAGISVVTVGYRFIPEAEAAGVKPPVQWPLRDAARSVQFLRSKAGEWGLNKQRIGYSGESAGGCTSLWLAMHDDLAVPQSLDPVERESTRPSCVGVSVAQTTLDPRQIREWFNTFPHYGGHAFGFEKRLDETDEQAFFRMDAARDQIQPWIREYSPVEHASADDPPICLYYQSKPPGDTTHGALFGVKLKELLDSLGVECETVYPGHIGGTDKNHIEFLLRKLKFNTIENATKTSKS